MGFPGISGIAGFSSGAAGASGPPTLVNIGALATNASSPDPVDAPYPAGLAANDIALLHTFMYDQSGSSQTINTPSGWTLLSQGKAGNGVDNGFPHAIFWKRLTGSESGTVGVVASAGHLAADCLMGRISVWRGCITSGNPYEQLGTNNVEGTTAMTGSSVTTQGDNRTVLNLCACDGATTSTPASGWTEEYDSTTGSGTGGAIKLYSIQRLTAGTYAAATHTLAAGRRWGVASFALIPA